jgi:hypothetical protein
MFSRILKAGMLVLAAVAALSFSLPASAAEWRGGGRGFYSHGFRGPNSVNRFGFHHGFDRGRGPQFADRGRFWRNRPVDGRDGFHDGNRFRRGRFDDGFAGNRFRNNGFGNDRFFASGRFDRHNRGPERLLQRSASPDIITSRGSGVTVILSDRSDVDVISNNYAGSADVYRGNGGTYVTGYSYGDDRIGRASGLRPRATVIDTARAGDPCSHENGVCVIRAR